MKKRFTRGILAALLMAGVTSAYSQPALQWARSLQLEGTWEGNATLVLGVQSFSIVYHMDFKSGIDGNALTMEEWFSDANLGDFKGLNLIGYSPYDDQVHWFSADNFGTAHEHFGSWSTQQRFHMEYHGVQGGLPFAEFIDMKLKANNTKLDVILVATLGGDTVQVISGTMIRQNNNHRMLNGDEADAWTIYPNPAPGEINISASGIIEELIVTNESGQQVYRATPNTEDHALKLDAGGIYFVKVSSGFRTETKKIIITK